MKNQVYINVYTSANQSNDYVIQFELKMKLKVKLQQYLRNRSPVDKTFRPRTILNFGSLGLIVKWFSHWRG